MTIDDKIIKNLEKQIAILESQIEMYKKIVQGYEDIVNNLKYLPTHNNDSIIKWHEGSTL